MWRKRRWLHLLALAALLGIGWITPAHASRPADDLLQLAPPDATAILVVEGLREHAAIVESSSLLRDLRQLPAVRAWLASDRKAQFDRSCQDIARVLGIDDVSMVRDEILGDAVVLVLTTEPGAGPDPARGMVLTRVRDRKLLDRLLARLNEMEKSQGTLVAVERRSHAQVPDFTAHVSAGDEGRRIVCRAR